MPGKIEGTVISITESGNLVTDISADRLRGVPHDERVSIICDEHQTIGLFDATHPEPDFTFMAILGASGHLELTIVGDSAAMMLGIRKGEKVVVTWQ